MQSRIPFALLRSSLCAPDRLQYTYGFDYGACNSAITASATVVQANAIENEPGVNKEVVSSGVVVGDASEDNILGGAETPCDDFTTRQNPLILLAGLAGCFLLPAVFW